MMAACWCAVTNRAARPRQQDRTQCRPSSDTGTAGHFVGQPVGIHDGAVVAPPRLAVNEKITAAVPAYVTECDGLESLVVTGCHGANKSGAVAALGMVGSGSIKVASSSLARELFSHRVNVRGRADVVARLSIAGRCVQRQPVQSHKRWPCNTGSL